MRLSKRALLALLLSLFDPTAAFPVDNILFSRAAKPDPSDFSWISSYAALGDSFAAGIGAGKVLTGDGDAKCSRYDGAYPVLLNSNPLFGFDPNRKFQFKACSGDLSQNVMDQVTSLADKSQDLVSISAGGNDALLSDVLKACVYLPSNQDKCNQAIDATRDIINKKLQGNIDDLLSKLAAKMKDDKSIVVYTLYAKFFNADATDPCTSQTWNWFRDIIPGGHGIQLKTDLRKTLNQLVDDANQKITNAIASVSGSTRGGIKINIATADWDDTVGDRYARFCEPDSKGDPNDPSNGGLVFQRLDTDAHYIPPEKREEHIKRYGGDDHDQLMKRVPDDIGRVFHPNELGQSVIASAAMLAIEAKRAELLGVTDVAPSCPKVDPPYKTGKCSADIVQYQDLYAGASSTYSVTLKIKDADGNEIGHQDKAVAPPLSDHALSVGSKLQNYLDVHAIGQDLRFDYGARWWTSKDTDASKDDLYCVVKEWDGTKRPPEHHMQCFWQCPWTGFPSTDGSSDPH